MSVKLVFKFLFVCFAFGLPLQVLTEDKENSSADEGRELSSFEQFLQGTFTSQLSLPPEPPLPPITPEQRKKFPPPPSDKNELPQPVQQHIQAIEDLCKIDSLEEQVKTIKKALDELKESINFYLTYYNKRVNRSILRKIRIDLLENDMSIEWHYLHSDFRRNVSERFILHRSFMYRLEEENAGPKSFKWPWLHKVYRGFYCLSHGRPPTLP